MTAPCNSPALAYTSPKRLGNANLSGPPHRQSGIFLPVIRPGLRLPVSRTIGERTGCSDRKALRRSQVRFPKPARSPALKPG